MFNVCLCYDVMSVPGSLVITRVERANLLAPLCYSSCVFETFPYEVMGLDCIDSGSSPSSLLSSLSVHMNEAKTPPPALYVRLEIPSFGLTFYLPYNICRLAVNARQSLCPRPSLVSYMIGNKILEQVSIISYKLAIVCV